MQNEPKILVNKHNLKKYAITDIRIPLFGIIDNRY